MTEIFKYNNTVAGKVQTQRRYPIESGQTLVANQALMFNAAGTKLVAYNSSASRPFRAILKDAVTATSDTYADYYTEVEQFNAGKLVLANGSDTWQDIAETARGVGINLVDWNPRDLIDEESADSD